MIMDTPPPTELVTIEIQGSGCHIILDREDKFNALNVQMITELCTLFEWTAERSVGIQGELADSNGVSFLRTLVLSGAGRHFCAGADINMMRDAGANSPEENRVDSERLDRLFNGLWSHPCFTIGAIQGVALGGGAGLVACLDHVIATSNVKIALSEGKLGILPAVIGPYVYRRLGSACFRRLAMQASRIDATEALRTGFIEAVVDTPDDLSPEVDVLIEEVLGTGPQAVTLAKELTLEFDRWTGSDEELREFTLDFTSRMRGSKEGQEGLSSFLDKRPANWKNE
ncbi:MAG: enoyl-CoA hydratase/isomerase family protein [Euryarchaeota archaeon]|nr:enoyl-CoA hydratase/isomerase family protein [Euryarchaeota archaeon]MBT6640838.1 enoyl-CoA hydratase/isomerase family protein [Euryarchaeota archaeon]MBT6844464.1 enoyl-CoA hydratase/isomerase family protein [Euryarchaeota archaeon]HJL97133.1 enoyl-CoA hydratase-related protein [Candidatus Poseidoniaceae archaeon]